MAQFDVHHNKGNLKEAMPFVVLVQSSQFDLYRRRVVVPLVRRSAVPRGTPTVGSRMNPVFKFGGHSPVKMRTASSTRFMWPRDNSASGLSPRKR